MIVLKGKKKYMVIYSIKGVSIVTLLWQLLASNLNEYKEKNYERNIN